MSSDKKEEKEYDGEVDDSENKASIPDSPSMQKHPLAHSWTMWYDSPSTTNNHDWKLSVKKIVSFQYVEDFWCLFNNLVKPSGLPIKGNYHLFKEGIMPAWEDPTNAKGGKWVIEFERRQADILDQVWLYTSLALIGEQFEDMSDISGAVISCRRQRNRLALWTKSAMEDKTQKRIGNQFKKIMEVPPRVKIGYQPHDDALKRVAQVEKGSGRAHGSNSRYEL